MGQRVIYWGKLQGELTFETSLGANLFPQTTFEFGIWAASADIVILDLEALTIPDVVGITKLLRHFCPRIAIVFILEPGLTEESIPQSMHKSYDSVVVRPVPKDPPPEH